MWCRQCCQDVPAVAAAEGTDEVVCARCGGAFAMHASTAPAREKEKSKPPAAPLPERATETATTAPAVGKFAQRGPFATSLLGLDDWELQSDLDQADQLLALHQRTTHSDTSQPLRRIDPPESLPPATSTTPTAIATGSTAAIHLSWAVWLLVCGGMMSLVFGMVLCGWSLGTAREDLWRIGLPALLGGQAALLLGFVFQLDSLWRNYKQASETLNKLDHDLGELRRVPHDTRMSHHATRADCERFA